MILLLMSEQKMFSQGLFTVTTNKTNYSYGEIIEVEVSIYNNTDSTILFHPECVYPVWVRIKGVEFIEIHSLADWCERYLTKGERETWTYQLNPSTLGFPVSDGEQIIYGSGYSHLDSVKITAPKYYGGIIEVKYDYVFEKEKRDNFFNSLNASVIKRDTIEDIQKIDELWSIKDKSIDSLVYEQNRSQDRFGYVDTYRLFEQGNKVVTSIDKKESIPNSYILMNNYPNPFNPSTNIEYTLPTAKAEYNVSLKIYNSLGQLVCVLVNTDQTAGTYKVVWDGRDSNGNKMPSGIYFYVLKAGDVKLTKKMILLR
jgi:hypothetical protein